MTITNPNNPTDSANLLTLTTLLTVTTLSLIGTCITASHPATAPASKASHTIAGSGVRREEKAGIAGSHSTSSDPISANPLTLASAGPAAHPASHPCLYSPLPLLTLPLLKEYLREILANAELLHSSVILGFLEVCFCVLASACPLTSACPHIIIVLLRVLQYQGNSTRLLPLSITNTIYRCRTPLSPCWPGRPPPTACTLASILR
jgi:hypothetical protein